MEDERIVLLYWDRDEAAISESSMKYGAYCTSIAQNILCLLYTSPSPRDSTSSRMPSSA